MYRVLVSVKTFLFILSIICLMFTTSLIKFFVKNYHLDVAIESKYITMIRYGGRLGNNIFRFATLYGIGKKIDRIPYISDVDSFQKHEIAEMFNIFSLLSKEYSFRDDSGKFEVIKFTEDCCKYENLPSDLYSNQAKYIKITTSDLQVPSHFENVKNDLLKIMECNDHLKQEIFLKAKQIWKNDSHSHKLCAHVRREDFLLHKEFKETTDAFLYGAIHFIYNEIQNTNNISVSLVIVGDDKKFIKNMNFKGLPFVSVSKLNSGKNRGFDMCFAIEYCDTFLLSSSMSTFGWWIGYLMKSQGPVYYDGLISEVKNYSKFINIDDGYPLHWKRLISIDNKHFNVS